MNGCGGGDQVSITLKGLRVNAASTTNPSLMASVTGSRSMKRLSTLELCAISGGEMPVGEVHLGKEVVESDQVGRIAECRRFGSSPEEFLDFSNDVEVWFG